MKAPTYAAMRSVYTGLWGRMQVLPTFVPAITEIAHRIYANKARYQAVAKALGGNTPWFFIGLLHYRESNLNFHCHLHNGDPLNARTRHVPPNRPPLPLKPPFTWEESAIDALKMRGLDTIAIWSVEWLAYSGEGYNGWGYEPKNTSSYLWAWSNDHERGKFVADHDYDPKAVDAQCGIMPILKALMVIDPSILAPAPKKPEPTPVSDSAPWWVVVLEFIVSLFREKKT